MERKKEEIKEVTGKNVHINTVQKRIFLSKKEKISNTLPTYSERVIEFRKNLKKIIFGPLKTPWSFPASLVVSTDGITVLRTK